MALESISISDEVRAKLETARVARLATVDFDGAPHIVPICFVFDGSVFYSGIDRKPKRVSPDRLARVRHTSKRPQVALLIDEYDDDWTRLWYVLVRGNGELVADPSERRRAVMELRAKYPQYATGMLDDEAAILRITPQQITSWGKI